MRIWSQRGTFPRIHCDPVRYRGQPSQDQGHPGHGLPTNINEVQRLIGRITALSQFISKSAEKGLPFFKTLRKFKNFEWTEECQQAFEDLKAYLAKLPLLVKPIPGDTLYLYISSTSQAVSSVLVREEEDMEFAIKFDFKASNNKAEYEALVLGMRMAQDTGASHLLAYSDSQLIVNDWRTPIIRWIDERHLPGNRWETTKIKTRAIRFLTQGGTLYKKSFTHPLLRCLFQEEGLHVLKEIHDGCCGSHIRTWTLANKALRAGYFWTIMKQDARYLVNKCEKCQKHATLIHQPVEPLNVMLSPCPFSHWGIDIVGPFPIAPGQRKFLLVAIDYFTKWVEAEPLARTTEGEVMKFIWKNIICRFGLPREIVSDNDRQF
ncbi:UNVERIFIED_CONTAM: hypothetical protein Slati_3673100 [Sesamum latifolium]|uniref:Integrase catalytic domain-containing protein n=1 Tax=Sesamum latifolium TaxID=2727402 RepID=A0AAW2U1Y0_9LAMI